MPTAATLVPEAIYRGIEERSESPLVESVGNLTSMLSQVQKLNLDDDWLTYSLSQSSSANKRACRTLTIEITISGLFSVFFFTFYI